MCSLTLPSTTTRMAFRSLGGTTISPMIVLITQSPPPLFSFSFSFSFFSPPQIWIKSLCICQASSRHLDRLGGEKKKSRREGHASNVVSLTSFEWQLSGWLSSMLMLCNTQCLSIITLSQRPTPPPTPAATPKNGSQPSGLSCRENLDSWYPAVQGSSSWISEELSRCGPNP